MSGGLKTGYTSVTKDAHHGLIKRPACACFTIILQQTVIKSIRLFSRQNINIILIYSVIIIFQRIKFRKSRCVVSFALLSRHRLSKITTVCTIHKTGCKNYNKRLAYLLTIHLNLSELCVLLFCIHPVQCCVQKNGQWKQVNTEFGDSTGYRIGYSYMNQTLFTFLPLIVLTVFNILLVRVVIGAARQRQAMTSAADMTSGLAGDQQRITVMLICVVVVFIVCQV